MATLDEYLNKLLITSDIFLENKSEEIYNKYYKDIPKSVYYTIVKSDPTTPLKNNKPDKLGKYSQWLLKLYKANKLKIEDLTKATEYLQFFDSLKKKNLVPDAQKDIGNIKSISELFIIIQSIGGTGEPKDDENYLLTDRYYINTGQAEIIYESPRWFIVNPKTIEASQFYACTSNWCTRFPENFNSYNSDGPLIVIINKNKINSKNNLRRLQFHFESNQFMDINDSPIEMIDFLMLNQEVADALKPVFEKLIENGEMKWSEMYTSIPELKQHAVNDCIKKGIIVPTEWFDLIPEDKKFIAVQNVLKTGKGIHLTSDYYNMADNRQKVFYVKHMAKRGLEIPQTITNLLEPVLLNHYMEELSKGVNPVSDNLFSLMSKNQKEEYLSKMINKTIQDIQPVQFSYMPEITQKKIIQKSVNSGLPWVSDKYFNSMPDTIKNYFIGQLYQKYGENQAMEYLTDNQYRWGTTYGFLTESAIRSIVKKVISS